MSLSYEKNLIPLAKGLRKSMTKHEKRLWYDFLRKYPIVFQRQKTIGTYIVDFYCHKAKIAIELDGSQHYEEKALEYDKERTEILNSYGIEVLRFLNRHIDENFEAVCMMIDCKVKEKIPSQNGGNFNG